ncbi:TRAP transporter substrate-binding protein [Ralstonia sp. 21YRMH01-3]|uniref:TRAP transporter substrate-binding protein n=2 Tax=Ralstonia chuxiongensis TaxID=2957504 RepID=A0AA42BK44_9RALS|nr:TRAP transporter substrate-binding protein [Ralstonia chuxiongensis]
MRFPRMSSQSLSNVTSIIRRHQMRTAGAVVIVPSFDGSAGIKSANIPAAVRDGQLDAGDTFGAALSGIDPVFELCMLPFVATTIDDARHLADLARPFYARAFEFQDQHLLYLTPWPSTGLWSRTPVQTVEALRGLDIRTYDKTSQQVMQSAGAKAESLSISDVFPRLENGTITAALSSSDGGAGRKLWTLLPNFTAINYAVPLSFATVSTKAYEALTPELRLAVDEAAKMTERHQWGRLQTRLVENKRRMQEHQVAVVDIPPSEIRDVLRAAAAPAVAEWKLKAGPVAAAMLDRVLDIESR